MHAKNSKPQGLEQHFRHELLKTDRTATSTRLTRIQWLPESLKNLASSRRLSLKNLSITRIYQLPESVKNLSSTWVIEEPTVCASGRRDRPSRPMTARRLPNTIRYKCVCIYIYIYIYDYMYIHMYVHIYIYILLLCLYLPMCEKIHTNTTDTRQCYIRGHRTDNKNTTYHLVN